MTDPTPDPVEQYRRISDDATRIEADMRRDRTVVPPHPVPGARRNLTTREVQIIQRVAEGRSNQQIGEDLGITRHTVKTHLTRISKALGTNRRERIVLLALRAGYIS